MRYSYSSLPLTVMGQLVESVVFLYGGTSYMYVYGEVLRHPNDLVFQSEWDLNGRSRRILAQVKTGGPLVYLEVPLPLPLPLPDRRVP